MTSFVSRLMNNFKSYLSGDPKYRSGEGQIRIAARDLEQLLDDYSRLDRHFRRQHDLLHDNGDCDHLITIVGGNQQERQGLANVLLLQMIVMGYSSAGRTPTWAEGETYLRLKNANKIVEPEQLPPALQYEVPQWPIRRPMRVIGTPQDRMLTIPPAVWDDD